MHEYRVIRSKRKTLSLSVARSGEIVVRAPVGYPDERIRDFVLRHGEWLDRRLAERPSAPSWGFGDAITLYGTEYVLRKGKPRIEGNELYLPETGREGALIKLLRAMTETAMGALTGAVAARYGFRYARVRVSSARGRWGSCNRDGVIAYTFRCAFLPPALAEYVVVHELCHTRCFHHGAQFRREVERVLPDWKERSATLRKFSAVTDYL